MLHIVLSDFLIEKRVVNVFVLVAVVRMLVVVDHAVVFKLSGVLGSCNSYCTGFRILHFDSLIKARRYAGTWHMLC